MGPVCFRPHRLRGNCNWRPDISSVPRNKTATITARLSHTTNTYTPTNTLINTYTIADANGRSTGNSVVGQNTSDLTFYWATASQLFMINADPGITFSGDWVQENVPSGTSGFNQRSFNSNVAAYSSGLGLSGASGDVSIATETANGVSSVTAQLYLELGRNLARFEHHLHLFRHWRWPPTLTGNNCRVQSPHLAI